MKEESEIPGWKLDIQNTKIMAFGPITSEQIDGKHGQTIFLGVPKSLQMVTAAMKLKDACPWKKNYDKPRQCVKKQRQHFANQGPYSQDYWQ